MRHTILVYYAIMFFNIADYQVNQFLSFCLAEGMEDNQTKYAISSNSKLFYCCMFNNIIDIEFKKKTIKIFVEYRNHVI